VKEAEQPSLVPHLHYYVNESQVSFYPHETPPHWQIKVTEVQVKGARQDDPPPHLQIELEQVSLMWQSEFLVQPVVAIHP